MRVAILTAVALVLATAPALTQEPDLGRPGQWKTRTDRTGAEATADLRFVEMPPGWHVTTGPAGILWDPGSRAEGRFRVEMEVYLFDPGPRREAFGLFVGGRDLEGEGQQYLYFLIREGGQFLVKVRDGASTRTIRDWTSTSAAASFADKAEDQATIKNVLRVEARESRVRFFVNGEEVLEVPRGDLPPLAGIVGLRVNHALNLHVSRLDVVQRDG